MEGKRETDTDNEMTHWDKVAALARANFGEEPLAEESTWQVVALISKGRGDYRSIVLVDHL